MSKPEPSHSGRASMMHCFRCHKSYNAKDKAKCIIEHDFDSFEGSRNGTSWYTGYLDCCGASYKFHRHGSDEKVNPKYCFVGNHTNDPEDVKYNEFTMKPCDESCGGNLKAVTEETYDDQKKRKKRERKEARDAKKARIEKLKSEGKRREARLARAEMLGISDTEDLNSDVDPDGCEEFDCASDSSIVPPWYLSDDE